MSQFLTVIEALNEGFLETLKLFAITLLGALPLGLIISFGSMTRFAPLRWLTRTVVWVVRGTPLMLQLIILFYVPGFVMENNPWAMENGRFWAAAVAFILNYACYFSEIYRGGIESISKGQYEAGYVLGLTKKQIFRKIILKQVVQRIVPPMSNEIITLIKDTALARVIGYADIIMRAEDYSLTGLIWPLFYTAVFFLLFVGLLTILFSRIEKKMSYYNG